MCSTRVLKVALMVPQRPSGCIQTDVVVMLEASALCWTTVGTPTLLTGLKQMFKSRQEHTDMGTINIQPLEVV